MSDHISGIAVVQAHPKVAGLYQVCLTLCGPTERWPCTLCFYDAANPPADLKAAEALAGEPVWQFKKDQPRHGWLDCQPSVRQRISMNPAVPDKFHNTFNWQVQYVWLKYTLCEARYNIWKILNQYGDDMPVVTANTFRDLQADGYIC